MRNNITSTMYPAKAPFFCVLLVSAILQNGFAASGSLMNALGDCNAYYTAAMSVWDFTCGGSTSTPFYSWGNSRNADYGPSNCSSNPAKCIAYGVVVMAGKVSTGGTTIPRLTLHAEDDGGASTIYTRAGGDCDKSKPITVGITWGYEHGEYGSYDLAVPFIDQLIKMGRPGTTIQVNQGWLGDLTSTQASTAQFPVIASYANYKGSSTASWFPNEYMAFVWRAYNARHPTVKKRSNPGFGLSEITCLNILKPAIAYNGPGMPAPTEITTDSAVQLSVKYSKLDPVADASNVSKLELFNGNIKLGELPGSPYGVWSKSGIRFGKAGIYSLIAIATRADGSRVTSRPALVFVRGPDRAVPFFPTTSKATFRSLNAGSSRFSVMASGSIFDLRGQCIYRTGKIRTKISGCYLIKQTNGTLDQIKYLAIIP